MSELSETIRKGRAFLAGQHLRFEEADGLWKRLQARDEISLARRVLEKLRQGDALLDSLPKDRRVKRELCRQEAKLTSKDPELSSSSRHNRALEILDDVFDLDDQSLDGDGETLGIAGGILKRRWNDLGQLEDLKRSASLYERGARGLLGEDAYCQINSAFTEDLLAAAGDDPETRRQKATALRERIVAELPTLEAWWNRASRAEALLGLGRYQEARQALTEGDPSGDRPAPWELRSSAEQLATLAHLKGAQPFENPEIRAVFEALLPGAGSAIRSAFVGKVGLALSGGGFRASFYHLGVLARLAELDVLRHLDVLSCVSGGSIVGACYWLALRRRLLDPKPPERDDYVVLVRDLIAHFERAVAANLRGQVQPNKAALVWRVAVQGEKGALDPEKVSDALEEHFYRPLLPGEGPLFMHDLSFQPADHDPELTGSATFSPKKHNWMRANKVPVLVLNATTVNTGHAWQFTPTWMGESPWAVHPAADSVPRLEWSWYAPREGWQIRLGRAVAASACVPGVFAPLRLGGGYPQLEVQLVDGGVHDNQGTVSLLAQDCNVLLVSDAAGQLTLEEKPQLGLKGLAAHALRSVTTLMERVRLANFVDLKARLRSGLLRGLMFVHMKADLDADVIRLGFSQEAYEIKRQPLTLFGVRKDFQQALAELRTDLDAFTLDESSALMACGYQMTKAAFEAKLAHLTELWEEPQTAEWPFAALLDEITSPETGTDRRQPLLQALRAGSQVRA